MTENDEQLNSEVSAEEVSAETVTQAFGLIKEKISQGFYWFWIDSFVDQLSVPDDEAISFVKYLVINQIMDSRIHGECDRCGSTLTLFTRSEVKDNHLTKECVEGEDT